MLKSDLGVILFSISKGWCRLDSNRWLGVLINDWEWKKIKEGTSHEQIDLYLSASQKYNVGILFFRLSDISLKNLTVIGNIKQDNQWYTKKLALPKVIHNRAWFNNKISGHKLRKIERTGIRIYNSWNGYDKLFIHQTIAKNPDLIQYLPITRSFTHKNLQYFLQRNSFFLKPNRGSVGRGIMKVSKISENEWEVSHQNKKAVQKKKLHYKKLYHYLSRYIRTKKYMIQETIDLLAFRRAPFDIRVSVQKNGKGKWQMNGMVGKVALKGRYLSNVAQGGSVVKLEKLFSESNFDYKLMERNLYKISLDIVHYLDKCLPSLADVGFDFGIDQRGYPYFIEMNSRDQRYSFLLANMRDTFRLTYENPIGYGHFLLKKAG